MENHLVRPGGCYNEDTVFEQCALQPSECQQASPNWVYRTASWMKQLDWSQSEFCRDKVTELLALGRCPATNTKEEESVVVPNNNEMTTTTTTSAWCTSDATACPPDAATNNETFVPFDPSCTVLYDLRPVKGNPSLRSAFGQCRLPTPTNPTNETNDDTWFGAWSQDDCPDNMEWDPIATNQQGGVVSCQDVRTGACGTETFEFYCAVSAQACSDPNEFYTIQELGQEQNKACWLCRDQAVPPAPQVSSVVAGACLVIQDDATTDLEHCALTPNDCHIQDAAVNSVMHSPTTLFVSPAELRQHQQDGTDPQELPWLGAALQCLSSGRVPATRVGKCQGDPDDDNEICTSHSAACSETATAFVPQDSSCTVRSRHPHNEWTQYGYCYHNGEFADRASTPTDTASYCAWSPSDCPETPDDEWTFVPPSMPLYTILEEPLPPCHCDRVRTGACVNVNEEDDKDDSYCAVDASACSEGYEFVSVHTLQHEYSPSRLCYLCGPPPPSPPPPSVDNDEKVNNENDEDSNENDEQSPVIVPTSSPTLAPMVQNPSWTTVTTTAGPSTVTPNNQEKGPWGVWDTTSGPTRAPTQIAASTAASLDSGASSTPVGAIVVVLIGSVILLMVGVLWWFRTIQKQEQDKDLALAETRSDTMENNSGDDEEQEDDSFSFETLPPPTNEVFVKEVVNNSRLSQKAFVNEVVDKSKFNKGTVVGTIEDSSRFLEPEGTYFV